MVSFGDITGSVGGFFTDNVKQVGGILQDTGLAEYLTPIGQSTFNLFQSVTSSIGNITSAVAGGIGNLLSGQTMNLILIIALGGVLIYGFTELRK